MKVLHGTFSQWITKKYERDVANRLNICRKPVHMIEPRQELQQSDKNVWLHECRVYGWAWAVNITVSYNVRHEYLEYVKTSVKSCVFHNSGSNMRSANETRTNAHTHRHSDHIENRTNEGPPLSILYIIYDDICALYKTKSNKCICHGIAWLKRCAFKWSREEIHRFEWCCFFCGVDFLIKCILLTNFSITFFSPISFALSSVAFCVQCKLEKIRACIVVPNRFLSRNLWQRFDVAAYQTIQPKPKFLERRTSVQRAVAIELKTESEGHISMCKCHCNCDYSAFDSFEQQSMPAHVCKQSVK